MEEVGLHRFLGKCDSKTINSIFPASEKQFISLHEFQDAMVFEDTDGREQTITYWHNYLEQLAKYEPGKQTASALF